MTPSGPHPTATSGRGGHVLLVGAPEAFVDRAMTALTEHAPELALTVSDSEAALGSLASADCVVLGTAFDQWTNVEAVEAIRERDPTLPVVAVVDGADASGLDTILSVGVTDVVDSDAPDALLAARLRNTVTTPRSTADGRRRDDERLGELKQRALDDADIGVVIAETTDDTPTVFANEGFGRLTGYDPEYFVGRNCRVLQGEATEEAPVESIREALSDEEPVSVVLRNYRKDGTEFWNEVDIEPITDGESVTHFLGFQRDVTERVELRRELETVQESLRDLSRVTTDVSHSLDERIEQTLRLACERLDVRLGFVTRIEDGTQHIVHAVGDHPLLQPGEACPLSKSYCRRTLETDGLLAVVDPAIDADWRDDPGYELFGLECYLGGKVRVDGVQYGTLCFADTEPRAEPFTESQTAFVELLTRWISYELERKRSERNLRTATRRFRAMFDNPQTFAAVLDCDGTVREINNTALATLESPDAAVGRFFWAAPWWTPDDEAVEAVRNAVKTAATGEAAPFECAYFHRDGSGTVSATIYPVYDAPEEDGPTFDDESGVDADGTEVVSLMAIGTDTTTRTEQAEQLRRQRDRFEEFASVVSHDLRSPLEVARGRLHLYETSGESRHVQQAMDSIDRMATLIDDLLELARQGEAVSDATPTPVDSVARQAWSTVQTDRATLTIDVDPDLTVEADQSRFRQLFENLFRNSVEHGSADDDGLVSIRVVELETRPGFAVEDDGVGIDPDDREYILDRGFTTNEKGTGFGLAIVARVVDAHGWDIDVTESDTGGARFEVSFGSRGAAS